MGFRTGAGRRWPAIALVLVMLLAGTTGTAPSSAQLVAQDDAGSGGDAADSPEAAFLVEPGVVYHGRVQGELHIGDPADWYAFEAQEPGFVNLQYSGASTCLELFDPALVPVRGHKCIVAQDREVQVLWLAQAGTYYLEVQDWLLPHHGYRFSFSFDGRPPDPRSDAAKGPDPDHPPPGSTETCPGATPAETNLTSGAGDPTFPSLTWAALKTGFRAVVTWETGSPATAALRYSLDGGEPRELVEPHPRRHHLFVLDDLPVGHRLCFQPVVTDGGSRLEGANHGVHLTNALTADGPPYTINLLVQANEQVIERPLLESGLERYAERLWDATDGNVRAGRTIVVYGDIDREAVGPMVCDDYATLPVWGCHDAFDVVFGHSMGLSAAGTTTVDGIQTAVRPIWMNSVVEAPLYAGLFARSLFGGIEHVEEVGSVLTHEVGHYALGAVDLYHPDDCHDPSPDISIMSSLRGPTELDGPNAPCPDRVGTPGYTPSWTLLQRRFPGVPDRPSGPDPGPTGNGSAYALTTVDRWPRTPYDTVQLPEPTLQNDAGSGRDAPDDDAHALPVQERAPYTAALSARSPFPVDTTLSWAFDTDWYAFEVAAPTSFEVRYQGQASCLRLYGPDGTEVLHAICLSGTGERVRTADLHEPGRYRLAFSPWLGHPHVPYQFSFGLGEPAPPLG